MKSTRAPGGAAARRRHSLGRPLLATALAIGSTLPAAGAPAWAATAAAHRKPAPGTTTTTLSTSTTTVAPLPLPVSPPPAAEDTCVKGNWEPSVSGKPAAFSSTGYGAYLWHDPDGGWALRVTDPLAEARTVFSGSLASATGEFTDVAAVGAGPDDIVYQANKHVIYFHLVDFGQVDGLNFATECAKAFTVLIRVAPPLSTLAPAQIYLGGSSANPAGNPFRVVRGRAVGSGEVLPPPS